MSESTFSHFVAHILMVADRSEQTVQEQSDLGQHSFQVSYNISDTSLGSEADKFNL